MAVQSYRLDEATRAPRRRDRGLRRGTRLSPLARERAGHMPSARWDDAAALEEAVIRGVSRFRDRGSRTRTRRRAKLRRSVERQAFGPQRHGANLDRPELGR